MNRECEVCGKEDLEVFVCASSIGPISFAYCKICMAIGAEPKGMLDAFLDGAPAFDAIKYYDKDIDNYRYYNTNEVIKLETKNRITYKNRTELAKIIK
jgi:hypothetical protein